MPFKKGLNLTAWERELHNDYDKEFLLNGIKSGFDIIDPKASPTSVELSNHPSARASNPLYKQEAHGPHRSPEKTVQINKHI